MNIDTINAETSNIQYATHQSSYESSVCTKIPPSVTILNQLHNFKKLRHKKLRIQTEKCAPPRKNVRVYASSNLKKT